LVEPFRSLPARRTTPWHAFGKEPMKLTKV
jgi:hypothetical protein